MKKFLFISSMALVLLVASLLSAGNSCRTVLRTSHHVQKVVAPVAVPVYVPTYQAQYTGNQQDSQNQQLLQTLQLMNQRLQLLEQRLQLGQRLGQGLQQPQQLKQLSAIEQLFGSKCASCHSEGGKKSGGLALVQADGQVARLECEDALEVINRAYAGSMPPKNSGKDPLTDEEFKVLMSWASSLRNSIK